jgi:hypothetical protein
MIDAVSRRSFLGLATAAAASSVVARPKPALTLDELVRRNTLARGGRAALDRVRSILINVEIQEGGMTLNGRYAADAAGRVRIDIYADGKLVGGEGVDGPGVWLLGKDGPEPSKATGAANALTNGAENHLFGWHRFAERGHKLALMPSASIDGTDYPVVVVEVRYSTGHVSYFYVDPATWLAARRRDERAYHPDVSDTKQRVETRYSAYTKVASVVAAHLNEDYDLASGKLLSTSRVLSRQINPALPADYFDRNRRAPPALT